MPRLVQVAAVEPKSISLDRLPHIALLSHPVSRVKDRQQNDLVEMSPARLPIDRIAVQRRLQARLAGAHLARTPAQKACYLLTGTLPRRVPKRGVQSRQRPGAVAARELVLFPFDQLHRPRDVGTIGTKRSGHHLPVKDLRRDIGVLGRGLAPAESAVLCRDTHKAHELAVKGFKSRDAGHAGALSAGIGRKHRHMR